MNEQEKDSGGINWGGVLLGGAGGYIIRAAQDSWGNGNCGTRNGCGNNTNCCGVNQGAVAFEVNQVERVSALQAEVAALRMAQSTDAKIAALADRVSEKFASVQEQTNSLFKTAFDAIANVGKETYGNGKDIACIAEREARDVACLRELEAKNQEINNLRFMHARHVLHCSDVMTANSCPIVK